MNRKILQLTLPNIVTNVTVPLVGMIDIAIAGRVNADLALGAVAIGSAIFNFIYWNFGFLRMGTTGFAAQAYGARNLREATNVLIRGCCVALFISAILLIFQLPLGRFSLWIMQGSPEVMQLAKEYFFIRIWAAPATIGLYAFKGWFIGMQNPRSPMVIAIIVCVVNFICGVWFVFGMNMGIVGIALSTVIAQYCGLLSAIGFCIKYYHKLSKYINIHKALQWNSLKLYFSVNGNIFIRTLCLVSVFTFFTSASSGMGNELLAVNTLLMQLFTLYSYIMDGFAYAGESLIGKFVGNNNLPMIRKCVSYLMLWGIVMGTLFTLIYAVSWRPVLSIFTDDWNIINLAGDFLWWILAVPLVGFTAFIYDGILTGATRTDVMRNAIIIAAAAFFIIYYSLKPILSNDALWVAFLTFLILRGALQALSVKGYKVIKEAHL